VKGYGKKGSLYLTVMVLREFIFGTEARLACLGDALGAL
jgi:hypothetical protein